MHLHMQHVRLSHLWHISLVHRIALPQVRDVALVRRKVEAESEGTEEVRKQFWGQLYSLYSTISARSCLHCTAITAIPVDQASAFKALRETEPHQIAQTIKKSRLRNEKNKVTMFWCAWTRILVRKKLKTRNRKRDHDVSLENTYMLTYCLCQSTSRSIRVQLESLHTRLSSKTTLSYPVGPLRSAFPMISSVLLLLARMRLQFTYLV